MVCTPVMEGYFFFVSLAQQLPVLPLPLLLPLPLPLPALPSIISGMLAVSRAGVGPLPAPASVVVAGAVVEVVVVEEGVL